jgi:hypothetical protein
MFEKMPNWLRWVLFIPIVPAAAVVYIFFVNISFIHLLNRLELPMLTYIIERIFYNLFGICFCLTVSINMIPKGKVVLSSVYLGITLLAIGMSIAFSLLIPSEEYAVWQVIYESILSVLAALISLIMALSERKITVESINEGNVHQ